MLQAEALNAEGNALFKTGSYQDAISKYSDASKADPTVPAYHSNASACWEKLEDFSKMEDCARECIEVDKNFLKGHIQLTTALKRLFAFDAYKKALEDGLKVESNNADLCRMKNEIEKCNFDKEFNETFEELQKGYSHRTEFVDMSKRVPCSYKKWDDDARKYEKIILDQSYEDNDTSDPPPVELRGITLRQLRAVGANILRRCEKEGWVDYNGKKLSANDVSLYDVDRYIIRPYTRARQLSFVTCLPSTAGPQPPRFFVSHWWGEPVVDFINCCEQAVVDFGPNKNEEDDRRGGGLTEDTPLWVCAYGNNQHNLSEDISDDPRKSGFTRAMQVAEGRTISILDKGGIVFERIWCGYELYLTLVDNAKDENGLESKKGIWAVYTLLRDRVAVGIISGGAPADEGVAHYTKNREKSFPLDLIKRSLSIKVENAKASMKEDRVRILNAIIGRGCNDMNEIPPTIHPKYDEVNDAVIAAFVSTPGGMRKIGKEVDDDTWKLFLSALSKGKRNLALQFDSSLRHMKGGRAAELISNLPATVSKLEIVGAPRVGVGVLDAISEYVTKTATLELLYLFNVTAGEEVGRQPGVRLAEAIATNKTLKTLLISYKTDLIVEENVEQWGAALNANTTLETFEFSMLDDTKLNEKLREITKDRTPNLKFKS